MKLQPFLAKKPLFTKKFDPKRMERAYRLIANRLSLAPIVHIVGTNGKGSTGRFLAGMLKEAGLKVGHYTSPHIFRFNERIWLDGSDIDDKSLEELHQQLQEMLPSEVTQELSYFEYTTFLAVLAFQNCDIAVIEAGLGGEFDATAVFDNILTLVTPIDYDHKDFLGNTIEAIAKTKLNAIKKEALIGFQHHPIIYELAKGQTFLKDIISQKELKEAQMLCQKEGLAPFFAPNLLLAFKAAQKLRVKADMAKGVKYRLRGRFERHRNIALDVGHNILSAKAIVKILPNDTFLVYNSYEDKDYESILKILKPKVKKLFILPINHPRALEAKKLIEVLEENGFMWDWFRGIDKKHFWFVYGSFSVVEEFLKNYECEIL